MKIGIIGANGQVGRELTFILSNRGHEVVPIVRNKIAASLFVTHNFNCEIISYSEESESSIENLDILIISAFTSYVHNSHLQPSKQRNKNENIIQKSVELASKNTTIIYFSSIAAFGNEVHDSSDWNWYTREKRHCEKHFKKILKRKSNNKNGVIFRLGHVLGPTQAITSDIQDVLSDNEPIWVDVSANSPSNTIHISNIADCIIQISKIENKNARYTAVNNPQWTWQDVFDFYSEEKRVLYSNDVKQSNQGSFLADLAVNVPIPNEFLIGISTFIPENIVRKASYQRLVKEATTNDINNYKNGLKYYRSEFGYDKVPDPYISYNKNTPINSDTEIIYEYLLD